MSDYSDGAKSPKTSKLNSPHKKSYSPVLGSSRPRNQTNSILQSTQSNKKLEGIMDLPFTTQGSDSKNMSSRDYVRDLKEQKMVDKQKESLKRLQFVDREIDIVLESKSKRVIDKNEYASQRLDSKKKYSILQVSKNKQPKQSFYNSESTTQFRKKSSSPAKDFGILEQKRHYKNNSSYLKADLQQHQISQQINQLSTQNKRKIELLDQANYDQMKAQILQDQYKIQNFQRQQDLISKFKIQMEERKQKRNSPERGSSGFDESKLKFTKRQEKLLQESKDLRMAASYHSKKQFTLPSILNRKNTQEKEQDEEEEYEKRRKTRLDRLHILSSINIKNNP